MALLLLAALTCGGAAFTAMLWVTGYGTIDHEATLRLGRIKSDNLRDQLTPFNLRRKVGVRLAGMNVVNAKVVAAWSVKLERAGLQFTPKEYFILRMFVGVMFAGISLMFIPVALVAPAVAFVGYLLVGVWLNMRITQRSRKLESQLPEFLQMVASGLKAGFGLIQAMEAATEQMRAPMNVEMRRTLRDTAMGASVEAALGALNERVGSSDFDIAITAILIQRTVGGNLAEILENVAHTMRERDRIRGEIRTLTSQQRLTGYVLGGLPIVLGGFLFMINPSFMSLLVETPLGRLMLGGAAVLEIMGFLVIRKIVNIEV